MSILRLPLLRGRLRVVRLVVVGEAVVAPGWVWSGAVAPFSVAFCRSLSSLAGSLEIFGEAIVPSGWTLGRPFCGVGSSAFFLSIEPSELTPYRAL